MPSRVAPEKSRPLRGVWKKSVRTKRERSRIVLSLPLARKTSVRSLLFKGAALQLGGGKVCVAQKAVLKFYGEEAAAAEIRAAALCVQKFAAHKPAAREAAAREVAAQEANILEQGVLEGAVQQRAFLKEYAAKGETVEVGFALPALQDMERLQILVGRGRRPERAAAADGRGQSSPGSTAFFRVYLFKAITCHFNAYLVEKFKNMV